MKQKFGGHAREGVYRGLGREKTQSQNPRGDCGYEVASSYDSHARRGAGFVDDTSLLILLQRVNKGGR